MFAALTVPDVRRGSRHMCPPLHLRLSNGQERPACPLAPLIWAHADIRAILIAIQIQLMAAPETQILSAERTPPPASSSQDQVGPAGQQGGNGSSSRPGMEQQP